MINFSARDGTQGSNSHCRSCFLSSGKGFKAETYTSPIAMQSLLRSFGFNIASDLADRSLSALEQATEVLHSHLQSKCKELLTLQAQLQVGFEKPQMTMHENVLITDMDRSLQSLEVFGKLVNNWSWEA